MAQVQRATSPLFAYSAYTAGAYSAPRRYNVSAMLKRGLYTGYNRLGAKEVRLYTGQLTYPPFLHEAEGCARKEAWNVRLRYMNESDSKPIS